MGLEPAGELCYLVDRYLNPIDLPLDGVLLTDKLAELLHVQPGNLLAIEVLEEPNRFARFP